MSDYLIHDTTLEDIADAIRSKTGGSSLINVEDMADEIADISIASIAMGLEATEVSEQGQVTSFLWHGTTVPRSAFQYAWYNGFPPTIYFADEVTSIGNNAFSNAYCWINFDDLTHLETAGDVAFTIQPNAKTTEGKEITLPLYTGLRADGNRSNDTFRVSGDKYIKKMYFPRMQYIGNYVWYQRSVPDTEIAIGSVGYPLLGVNSKPFGGSSGTGSITVYTTGSLLDTVKTALLNQASSSYTWTFKAAEETTYNGTTYNAGDTMLTV